MGTEVEDGYQVLGPVRIRRGGSALAIGAAKAECLLAVLLVRADRTVSAALIAEELWGQHPPRTARTALHVYVSRLRTILSAGSGGAIVTQDSGYRFRGKLPDSHPRTRRRRIARPHGRITQRRNPRRREPQPSPE
jgi:two-component SAPR family response regulator